MVGELTVFERGSGGFDYLQRGGYCWVYVEQVDADERKQRAEQSGNDSVVKGQSGVLRLRVETLVGLFCIK